MDQRYIRPCEVYTEVGEMIVTMPRPEALSEYQLVVFQGSLEDATVYRESWWLKPTAVRGWSE